MGTIGVIGIVVALLLLAGGVAFAVALSRRSRAELAENLGTTPGTPKEWAGNHTPEAKLHRRLTALGKTAAALPLGDAAAIERGVAVQQRIAELDRLLVAVAGAPESARRDAVAKLEPDVETAEAEVAALATEPPLL